MDRPRERLAGDYTLLADGDAVLSALTGKYLSRTGGIVEK
jgi:hypothetical protein